MSTDLAQNLLFFIPVILSLTVHEWAHAASARALGDDTAEREGRLTMNPVVHMDPLGTLLLPLVQLIAGGMVYFAWAKPVPFNPARFRRDVSMSTGTVIVSAAGPIANVVLAVAAAVAIGLLGPSIQPGLLALLGSMLVLNVVLAIFNLLPIPPLDGSKVLHGLLPRRGALVYERIFPYAPVLLLAFLIFGRGLLHGPVSAVQQVLFSITRAISG